MKNKILIILALGLFFGFAFQQAAKYKITENDYFDFINAITDSWAKELKTTQLSAMSNKPALDEIYSDTAVIFKDPMFSKRDVIYFRKQLAGLKDYAWPKAKLSNYKILTQSEIDTEINASKEGWKEFSKKHGNVYYVYSVPLFTFDKKRCIIAVGQVCGLNCRKGSIYLYAKDGTVWKKTKEFSSWKD